MKISFTLPDSEVQLLLRLASCIGENSNAAPDPAAIARSLVIDILRDDALHNNQTPPFWTQ